MFGESDLPNGVVASKGKNSSQSRPSQHISERSKYNPGEKMSFSGKGMGFLRESEMGSDRFRSKTPKTGTSGSQDLRSSLSAISATILNWVFPRKRFPGKTCSIPSRKSPSKSEKFPFRRIQTKMRNGWREISWIRTKPEGILRSERLRERMLWQNDAVLVRVKTLILAKAVLIFVLILFFSSRGHFSNLLLLKRRNFNFFIHFDSNTNGRGQNVTFW